jgi:hypothetical protein
MGWSEAWRMLNLLAKDPSSWVAVALGGWERPATYTELAVLDLFDLQHTAKAKSKPKPHQRPWDKATSRQAFGSNTPMTIADFEALKASQFVTEAAEEDGDG